MTHEHAWTRLPDLLEDRDEPELLAHVSVCHECQRQLFLLGRVDRLLRDAAPEHRREWARARRRRWLRLPARLGVAAAVALLVLLLPQKPSLREFTLRIDSGQAIGHAVLTTTAADKTSLSLVARGLPARHENVYVLWAGGGGQLPTQVGGFMVDPTGTCRARFDLPDGRSWARFWVTPPGRPNAVVATT